MAPRRGSAASRGPLSERGAPSVVAPPELVSKVRRTSTGVVSPRMLAANPPLPCAFPVWVPSTAARPRALAPCRRFPPELVTLASPSSRTRVPSVCSTASRECTTVSASAPAGRLERLGRAGRAMPVVPACSATCDRPRRPLLPPAPSCCRFVLFCPIPWCRLATGRSIPRGGPAPRLVTSPVPPSLPSSPRSTRSPSRKPRPPAPPLRVLPPFHTFAFRPPCRAFRPPIPSASRRRGARMAAPPLASASKLRPRPFPCFPFTGRRTRRCPGGAAH